MKSISNKDNRREKEDRRSFGPAIQFPFVDSADKKVEKDRRFMPDRRIANIQVTGHVLYINSNSLRSKL